MSFSRMAVSSVTRVSSVGAELERVTHLPEPSGIGMPRMLRNLKIII